MSHYRIQVAAAALLLLLLVSHTQAIFVVKPQTPKAKGGKLTPLANAAVADLWTPNGLAPFSIVAGGLNGDKKDAYATSVWQVIGRDWRLISDGIDKKSAAVPTPRRDAAAWAVNKNNNTILYIFGGFGTAASDTSKGSDTGYFQDLRTFDLRTSTWSLISGTAGVNQTSKLGASAIPGSRADAMRWTDGSYLYVYGGVGYDRNTLELLEDFWQFSISNSQWSRIAKTSSLGARASASVSRYGDKVFIFGGESYTAVNGYMEASNDLWVWSNTSGFTLVSPVANTSYETVGVPSATAHPGPREESVMHVTGTQIWIYGGLGYDAEGNYGVLSDVWSFDLSTNQWCWMGGSSLRDTTADDQFRLPPRAHTAGWSLRDSNSSSFWVYGGMSSTNNLKSDMWQFLDYPNPNCSPLTGCMCLGVPISASVVCVDGSWVFVTNEPSSEFSVVEPPPVTVGSVLDVQLHSLNILGDFSISGTLIASFDASSADHGSLLVTDGCPYIADGAAVQIDVSQIQALLNQPRRVVLLQWDSALCSNFTTPSFSSVYAAPATSTPSTSCGSIQAQQQVAPGSLSLLFSFVPAPDCPVPPSGDTNVPPTPSGSGGITDPGTKTDTSTINALPIVFGVVALIVVGTIIAGVVIYRRRFQKAKEEAVGAAVSSLYRQDAAGTAAVSSVAASGAAAGDAGWWIDAPESPRSVTSRDERDGTVPADLVHVPNTRPKQSADPTDSLPIPDVSIGVITPRGPIPSPSNISIPSKSKNSDSTVRFVEVAGSGDSDSSLSGSLRVVSSRSSRNRRIIPSEGSGKVESDAGSESDSASDSEFVRMKSMVQSMSASSVRHQHAVHRSQIDLSSSSSASSGSQQQTQTIDISEDDVEFERSTEESAGIVYLGKWMGSRVSLRPTTLILPEESLNLPSMQSILFMSELRAIVEMPPHKNVLRVWGHFQRRTDSTHFLVSEYAPRGPLSGLLPTGTLTVREKIKIIERTAAGLAHLHEHGILMHKHMNASSVLLDAALRPKLSNYGLLLAEKHAAAKSHADWISFARWLAPEVCRQGAFSVASDVYSFGVFISQVLTEKIPFDGLSDIDAMMEITENGTSPEVPEWCPRYLREVAQVCMNEDSRERPNMDDVVALLRMVRRGSIASELESV
eukprot:TRINITY_DN13570_c0_g1_i1.p1 TRINITY_DN13570_c0_g1~~TRINITY_DN13570_c0_g1_i1.p1  ORF type:complete len:1145 (-),score=181.03 TRINITY_DN13570_c0_g1_i1:81-3515(-)